MKHLALVILIIWYVSSYGCETLGIPEPDVKVSVVACPKEVK